MNEQEENTQQVIHPKPPVESPGGLRSDVAIKLQTFQAHKLVHGRRSDHDKEIGSIVGLLEFGRRMKLIWLSAEQDDPFADWYLLEIEQLLEKARKSIAHGQTLIEKSLRAMEGVDVQIAETESPISVKLQFNNPYGYKAAYLLLDFDKLVRSLLTARYIGILDRSACEAKIRSAGGPLRHAFLYATKWRFTGVVRKDIHLENQAAKRAIELFGECPGSIASGEKRAGFAPMIKKASLESIASNSPDVALNGSSEQGEGDMFVVETNAPVTETISKAL